MTCCNHNCREGRDCPLRPRRKFLPAILALFGLSACADLSAYDYTDAGTTALAVAQGASEANPLIGIAGDGAAPVVALVAKAGAREYMRSKGYSECEIDRTLNTSGVLGTVNNLLVVAGASGPIGLLAGGVAAVIYHSEHQCATVTVIVDPRTGEKTYE